jgi:hypothetical protein
MISRRGWEGLTSTTMARARGERGGDARIEGRLQAVGSWERDDPNNIVHIGFK